MAKKTYVLDTSVCLTDANCIYQYQNNDIVLPLKVLEEIDGHKKRQDSVGANARKIIRTLDSLRAKGNLEKGVRIARSKGILKIVGNDPDVWPEDLDLAVPDHIIISSAISEDRRNGRRKTIMVSRDINMRVICDALGLSAEGYTLNQVVTNHESLYTGFKQLLVDEQLIDQFYAEKDVFLDTTHRVFNNQFVMLVSSSNEKKTALARFCSLDKPLKKIQELGSKGIWGVKARNKEQAFALDLLLDPTISLISLVGESRLGENSACNCRWNFSGFKRPLFKWIQPSI